MRLDPKECSRHCTYWRHRRRLYKSCDILLREGKIEDALLFCRSKNKAAEVTLLKTKLSIFITVLAFANCARLLWENMRYVLFASFDTGWIVRTGQYIIASYGVPHTDMFSWTHPERAFVAYQWLAELWCGFLYTQGGLWLVGLFFAQIAGFTYLFLLPILWIKRGVPPAIPYLLLMLVLSPHWFNVRPQMFSYFFLLLFIYILEHYRTNKDSAYLRLLVLASAIWANVHLFWCVGLMLTAVYTGCELWRSRHAPKPTLLVIFALCAAAVTINPYGAGIYSYLWTFLNKSQFMGMNEVLPLWSLRGGGLLLAFLVIAGQTIIRKRKSLPAEAVIVFILATLSALCVRRYGSLAVVLVWPYFGLALSHIDWKQYTWVPHISKSRALIMAAVSLAIPGIMWTAGCSSENSAKNLYVENCLSALNLVNGYLTKVDRVFNDPPTGDWLILCTDVPVWIDTRYDMYPKIFCQDTFSCLWAAPQTLDYIKGHGATHIVVRDDFEPINKLLDQSSEWILIIDDGTISFWGRNTPGEEQRLSEKQLTDSTIKASKLAESLIKQTMLRRAKRTTAQSHVISK
jgi:hypothetical protein